MGEKGSYSEGVLKIVERISDPQIKVVSFDVFDTLLLRPVSTPADIFRLLENKLNIPNYHNMRVAAEAEARKRDTLYVQDITLKDIYDTYSVMFGITEEETERLKQEELDIEYTLLYARKTAKYLYEQAKVAGKEIIIISDMYLSSEFLDKCLKKNGYTEHTHIYVSSETGFLKSSKMMYQYVLSELALKNIQPNEVLHIGDNKKADVESAVAVGMNAMHLPKAVDVRNSCKQLRRLYDFILQDVMNSNNAMLYGLLANLYFDDPFVEYDKNSFFNGDAKLMGYWFAPLMIGFTKWMIECVEKDKIEQLLFVWRDGFLPLQLFQIMRPQFTEREIDIKKIYMGRDLRMPFCALDKNGLFTSFADNPLDEKVSVDYFIRKRLLCENDKQYNEILNVFLKHGYLNKDDYIGKFERYRGFLYELEPYFIKNSKNKIEIYSKYIESLIDRNKKIAVFDRSPRGKSSRFLQKYFKISGCCLTTEVYDTPKAKLEDINTKIEFYLEYGKNYINRMGWIWAQLFEIIISDRNPGFSDVVEKSDGTVSVILDARIENEIFIETDRIVKQIQNSVVYFVKLFSDVFGKYLPYMVIDKHGVFDFTIEVLSNPHIKDASLITRIYPGKSILSPIDENVFLNWYNRKFGKSIKNEMMQKKTPWDYIRHTGYVTAEKIGILPQARRLYRFIIGNPLEPVISAEKIQTQIDSQIEYLKQLDCSQINAILLGSVPQETNKFFNQLSHLNQKLHFLFVASGFLKVPTWLDFPCIGGPELFSFWGIEGQNLKIKIPAEIRREVNEKTYLLDLVKRRVLRGYSESVSIMLAFGAERYFDALIEKINPSLVLVWNNWGNNSVVPSEIAKRKGIPVISVERGFLEGTMMLSPNGYGKDLINMKPEEFCQLPVDVQELDKAQKIIHFLGSTGFNRYVQPVNDTLEKFKEKLGDVKPNILLVGAFDCENPAFPQNEIAEETYSNTFATSYDAMLYISKLAKKNGWNFIYKPHPLMDKINSAQSHYTIPSNVFYVRDVNINELLDIADVVVCMISGVSYIALTRGKPLVELAHTPLKGKGCCYETNSISEIEQTIEDALKNGFTETQKRMFIRHIAQVNKYYFFDDLSVRPIRYGRTIEEAIEFLDRYTK